METKDYELIRTAGPFGDETCNYDVITTAKTVGEFIEIAKDKDNYGTFVIRTPREWDKELYADACVAYYNHGVLCRWADKHDEYCALKFDNIIVNGGWGAMNYDIFVSEQFQQQPRDEFMMTYFGHTFKK